MDIRVEAHSLTKYFGKRAAVNNISFEVQAGEIFGFIGPNGAGKTTTIRLLLGLLKPSSGTTLLFGQPAQRLDAATKRRVGVVLEASGPYDDLTVLENLQFYAEIYGSLHSESRIRALCDLTGLTPRTNDRARTLSKGMRQKLVIARALVHHPELLVLDEPTSGLDPVFQKEILVIISRLARDGTTVLLSSHNLHEVQEACSRVAIIAEGEIRTQASIPMLLARFQGAKKLLVYSAPEVQHKAEEFLKSSHLRYTWTNQGMQVLFKDSVESEQTFKSLWSMNLAPSHVEPVTVDLTDVFELLVM